MNQKTKGIAEILYELVENFAEWDDKEQAWWGHDTNLGNCHDAFLLAEEQIKKLIADKDKTIRDLQCKIWYLEKNLEINTR